MAINVSTTNTANICKPSSGNLASILNNRLSNYGYSELERKFFSESGKRGSLPLLAETPKEDAEKCLEIRIHLESFIKSQRYMSVSNLKNIFSKTLRLKNDDVIPNSDVMKTPYDKLRRITELLLANSSLRDEMYCQLMKIIHDNSRDSTEVKRSWQVMKVLVAMSLPTTKMLLHLAKFIDDAALANDDEIRRNLVRTIKNGQRYQPVSYLEFLSLDNDSLIEIPIRLMDGSIHFVKIDPSTNASEVVDRIGIKLKLRDYFGLSLFVCLNDKTTSLGIYDKILDSITRCEDLHRKQNAASFYLKLPKISDAIGSVRLAGNFQNGDKNGSISGVAGKNGSVAFVRKFEFYQIPLKFYIKKEIFAPWDDDMLRDGTGLNLCYAQICKGHMNGEYSHFDGHAVSTFVANRYFIEHGEVINEAKLRPLLKTIIPKFWLGEKASDHDNWIIEIIKKHKDVVSDDINADLVKWGLIMKAKKEWSKIFTKIFYGRDPGSGFLVLFCINSEGMTITSSSDESVILSLKFYEIQSLNRSGPTSHPSDSRIGEDPCSLQKLNIETIDGKEFNFETQDATEIDLLINGITLGLDDRSEWAVAYNKRNQRNHDNLLLPAEGALLQLVEPLQGEELLSDWRLYRDVDSGREGRVHVEDFYVIPSIERPDNDSVNLLRFQSRTEKTKF